MDPTHPHLQRKRKDIYGVSVVFSYKFITAPPLTCHNVQLLDPTQKRLMLINLVFISRKNKKIKEKGSNMPLNYLKRFRYTLRLKFGPFIPSPSNFWSTYALLDVSWPTRNIQLILLLFKCQMDFPRHFMYYHLTFIFKGKGSNMPLNYSKGLDIPPFKVWSIYTLASKLLVYICPYGC